MSEDNGSRKGSKGAEWTASGALPHQPESPDAVTAERTPSKQGMTRISVNSPSPSPSAQLRSTNCDAGVLRELAEAAKNEKERQMEQDVQAKLRVLEGHSAKGVDTSALEADSETWRGRMLVLCAELLNNPKFDAAVGVVIVLNSISIGMEISADLSARQECARIEPEPTAACQDEKMSSFYKQIEHFFMFVYTFELCLRFATVGIRCLKNGWVLFDFVLVFLGVVTSYIIEPIMASSGNADGADLGPIMVLRVFRLLRLARALRLLVAFRTLWMLVRGLLMSGGTMTYTFALIFLILYIFACMGVEVFTKDYAVRDADPAYNEIVEMHFADIPTTMLTLVQFVTLDSVGAIYKPMIERGKNWFIIVYFVTFILMVSVSLMNLVTAVLVNGAIEQATSDKEAERIYKAQQLKRMLPKIREMFMELDADGSGFLELDELLNAPQEVREELLKYMKGDDIIELFECIDVDESGQIDVDEFCDGMARLTLSETPVETLRMMRQLQLIRREGDFRELNAKVDNLAECMDKLMKHVGVEKPKFKKSATQSLANYVPPTENAKGEVLRPTLIQKIAAQGPVHSPGPRDPPGGNFLSASQASSAPTSLPAPRDQGH